MFGNILRKQRRGGIAGFIVPSGCTERAHQPILPVRTGSKCCEAQYHDMPYGHIQVRYVGEGGGMEVHRQVGNVLQAAKNTDPLPVLKSRTYHGIDDGS